MTYDFDELLDRTGSGSEKWNIQPGELPMWVADMDFRTAPAIVEALEKRAALGHFGYSYVPDEMYDAYIAWWERRHHFRMERDWLVFSTGVVPTVSCAVRKLTTPGEKVLLLTPVYNIFYNSILNNGCTPLEVPLQNAGGEYFIDFEALEQGLSDPQCSLMILCNPHNPVGRIWTREELANIGSLCAAHHVTVLSDEIHCDITAPGSEYIPFASVSETNRSISLTCIAPTKTFSIPGINSSVVCVPDPFLRHKIWRQINTDECGEPNAFAVCATTAAFNESEEWLEQLRAYLYENVRIATDYITSGIPGLTVTDMKATYLLWIDCSSYNLPSSEIKQFLRSYTGLWITEGSVYGKGGEGHLRMNLACPRARLTDGLERLKKGFALLAERPGPDA